MAKMKAAMATVRDRMSNIYKADMLETCKAQDAAKGQNDSTKKKVVFNYDRNIVHLMHDGDAYGKVSTRVITKKKDTDTDGFVAVTKGKGSPSRKQDDSTDILKRTNDNSFTALQGKDDADDDDDGCFHDTVEFSKASPPSKSKRSTSSNS
jgi:2-methylcitrate dehydratase PrpD